MTYDRATRKGRIVVVVQELRKSLLETLKGLDTLEILVLESEVRNATKEKTK